MLPEPNDNFFKKNRSVTSDCLFRAPLLFSTKNRFVQWEIVHSSSMLPCEWIASSNLMDKKVNDSHCLSTLLKTQAFLDFVNPTSV